MTWTVSSTLVKGCKKRVNLEDERGCKIHLTVHAYAALGKGNKIFIDPKRASRIFVTGDEEGDLIPVKPHFEREIEFSLGNTKLSLKVTELISEQDLHDYEYLETFHYRGSTAVVMRGFEGEPPSQTGVGGRHAILIFRLKLGSTWQPVGYIKLNMPLQMCKPRHELFSIPFSHPTIDVAWTKWSMDEIKAHVNRIVRIARIVVSPEYRGLGLSRFLINAAKQFAVERWQIKGKRPLFMEISAEMLKYMDFVSSSKFRFIGNTEGNLKRIGNDLVAMQRRACNGSETLTGIMTLQKKYLTGLERAADGLDSDIDQLIDELVELTADPDTIEDKLSGMGIEKYYAFKSVLRLPIPYFLCGLDEYAQKYIEKYVSPSNRLIENKQSDRFGPKTIPKAGRISLRNMTTISEYSIPTSRSVQTIMNAFGLRGDVLRNPIFGPIDIDASGGNIIFVAGVSGSGKSVLLKAIDRSHEFAGLIVQCRDESRPKQYSSTWMRPINSEVPIIEYLAGKYGVESSLSALNRAGLSEAFAYIKPYHLLSRGQRYRAQIAELSLSNDPVWLIDEFCADLDPMSAKIVAHNLRKHVMRYNRIAFIAAANHAHFLDALRPTQIIYLSHGGRTRIMKYKEYKDELRQIAR